MRRVVWCSSGGVNSRTQCEAAPPAKTTFGQRLYALRTQRGLTQMELAKALGTTQRVISYYETKGELPPPDVLIALVRTLGASPHLQ
jgi:DNA-binding transcriptional regulator YiaG